MPKSRPAISTIDELESWGLDAPLVVADEGYGQDGAFRLAPAEPDIPYVVGIRSDTAPPAADARRTAMPYGGTGRRPARRAAGAPELACRAPA
ncbi:transposase [Streptosporangium sp. CA-135522]|uniref:transposase n=1 Tax=Streptosporangium sp. CA-135522 TaxID=3240072 RepID=UPI003D8E532A